MDTIEESARKIPVASKVDVVVVGAGCAGIAAALGAARSGVRVALIERLGFAGGVISGTMMEAFWMFSAGNEVVVRGIVSELFQKLKQKQALFDGPGEANKWYWVDSEKLKLLADEWLQAEGVELWYHSMATIPILRERSITGVIIESKSGRQAILASVIVDATGDGDIAARAKAPFEQGRSEDGKVQPLSIGFKIGNVDVDELRRYRSKNPDDAMFVKSIKKARLEGKYTIPRQDMDLGRLTEWRGLSSMNPTRSMGKDPTSVKDLTLAEIELRKQVYEAADFLRTYIPGCSRCEVVAIAPQAAARESRRISAEYVLTEKDIIQGASFPDRIAKIPSYIDLHDPTTEGAVIYFPASTVANRDVPESLLHMPGAQLAYADTYDLPFRCLVPLNVDNILTAGRCISATHVAVASIRYLPASMATGQAAGTAAALSVQQGVKPRDVDISVLQGNLLKQKVYLG